MAQEDEQLLLVDLCGKLPYGVKVLYKGEVKEIQYIEPLYNELKLLDTSFYTIGIEEVKPYLRPLSSMTEEEYNELKAIAKYYGFAPFKYIYDWCPNHEVIDWLNRKMFDYRRLISKGIAISTEEFNPYKD